MRVLRDRLVAQINTVVVGQDHVIDQMLMALLTRGHILMEGVPGTAKTLLANAFSKSLGLDFRRAQFTPDMLPSDLTGTMALRGGQIGELSFRPGPVFTNVLLADEINRTPPKTQSALLEAMGEGHVSIDGTTHMLPDPFLVIATQNPIEYEGTYPLPEAQLDRFALSAKVGYPNEDQETAMLLLRHTGVRAATIDSIEPATTRDELIALREQVDSVSCTEDVVRYVAQIVRATRSVPSVMLGASPRAAVHLLAISKARASLNGRNFVTPDDVVAMAGSVLTHRVLLRPEAEQERYRPEDAVKTAIAAVPVPR